MTINFRKNLLLFILLIFLLSGCKDKTTKEPSTELTEPTEDVIAKASRNFDLMASTLATHSLTTSPLDATFKYGDLESLGLAELLSELDSLSFEDYNEDMAYVYEILEQLDDYNYDDLNPDQQLTYDMLTFNYELLKDSKDFYYYDNLIQPTSGIHINIPLALMQIELKDTDAVDAYIERVKKIPELFNQVILFENEKATKGLLLPEDLYDDAINQIDNLLVEPNEFLMVQSFNDKIEALELSTEAKSKYKEQFLDVITNSLYPSYNALSDAIKDYKTRGQGDGGLASWDKGKDYYELLIKQKTSYDLSGEDLKDWATEQKANALDELINSYENNSSLMTLSSLSDVFPEFTDLEQIYEIEYACVDDLFYDYDISLATEEVIPSYLEEHLASGFYFPVSLDSKAYGTMFLREETYSNIDYYTLNLYFHENVPGHHFYFSYLANSNLPLVRKLNSWLPYEEGWAIYIEKYAYDYIGIEDSVAEFLKLNDDYFNYTVMLYDIRYHYEGESREALISELEAEGYPRTHAEAIINRIVANPCEVVHYYYGGYKFQSYLEQCQEALGDDFDIKAFHNLLLQSAGLPFTTMDRVIDEWIKSSKN